MTSPPAPAAEPSPTEDLLTEDSPTTIPFPHRQHLLSVLAPDYYTNPHSLYDTPPVPSSLSLPDAIALFLSSPNRPVAVTVLRTSFTELEVYYCADEYHDEEKRSMEEEFVRNAVGVLKRVMGRGGVLDEWDTRMQRRMDRRELERKRREGLDDGESEDREVLDKEAAEYRQDTERRGPEVDGMMAYAREMLFEEVVIHCINDLDRLWNDIRRILGQQNEESSGRQELFVLPDAEIEAAFYGALSGIMVQQYAESTPSPGYSFFIERLYMHFSSATPPTRAHLWDELLCFLNNAVKIPKIETSIVSPELLNSMKSITKYRTGVHNLVEHCSWNFPADLNISVIFIPLPASTPSDSLEPDVQTEHILETWLQDFIQCPKPVFTFNDVTFALRYVPYNPPSFHQAACKHHPEAYLLFYLLTWVLDPYFTIEAINVGASHPVCWICDQYFSAAKEVSGGRTVNISRVSGIVDGTWSMPDVIPSGWSGDERAKAFVEALGCEMEMVVEEAILRHWGEVARMMGPDNVEALQMVVGCLHDLDDCGFGKRIFEEEGEEGVDDVEMSLV